MRRSAVVKARETGLEPVDVEGAAGEGPSDTRELTREEYRRLLTGARAMGDRRGYVLVKTIVNTGVGISELENVTVETAKAGRFTAESHGVRRSVRIPAVLQKDLLEYVREEEIAKGAVFRGADGGTLSRGAVAGLLKGLAGPAGVPEDKCNARALRRLYQKTRAEAEDGVEGLVERMVERQIEKEQAVIGWRS